MYKIILSGFRTKDEAKKFLEWYEGQGEQDETIGIWMGDEGMSLLCDMQTGMIEHPDGYEYKLKIYDGSEEDEDEDEDY